MNPDYYQKAKAIADRTYDLCEVLDREITEDYRSTIRSEYLDKTVAFHPPCTLQHGQKITGVVESILTRVGYSLQSVDNSHLCCGSAGTYALLQPGISKRLKDNKVDALNNTGADVICTANIGCENQLRSGVTLPITHWVELLY